MRKRLLYRALLAGILLVVAAAPALAAPEAEAAPVRYPAVSLADPGGRVLLYFEIRNTSAETWPSGAVSLVNKKNPLSPVAPRQSNRQVLPGETIYWDFEVTAPAIPGITESVWQLMRGDTPLGPAMTCYVIAVPPEAQDLRAKIQQMVDDFNSQHGQDIKQLIRQISDLFTEQGKSLLQQLLSERCGLLPGLMLGLALVVGVRRRAAP
jgi:hypothetical protein